MRQPMPLMKLRRKALTDAIWPFHIFPYEIMEIVGEKRNNLTVWLKIKLGKKLCCRKHSNGQFKDFFPGFIFMGIILCFMNSSLRMYLRWNLDRKLCLLTINENFNSSLTHWLRTTAALFYWYPQNVCRCNHTVGWLVGW